MSTKDTKQLLENFRNIPNSIIKAVVEANEIRKNFIVSSILKRNPKIVGVYRLIMKKGSNNFRESAVIDILYKLRAKKIKIILYEPFISEKLFDDMEVFSNINKFISRSDIIIANRITSDLDHVRIKFILGIFFRKINFSLIFFLLLPANSYQKYINIKSKICIFKYFFEFNFH